jgi:hypothetical protein
MNNLLSKIFTRIETNLGLFLSLVMLSNSPSIASESAGDIFSTPDTTYAPVFAGRIKAVASIDPLFGPNGDPPTREAVRAIPSITGPQLRQLDDLINQTRDTTQPLQEQVASLRRILEQRKQQKLPDSGLANSATPPNQPFRQDHSMMMMADYSSDSQTDQRVEDSDDAIKNHIELLNQQIKQIQARLWPSIRAMLTPAQLDSLAQMHAGRLMIAKNSPTDLPPPSPPPNKIQNTPRPFAHPASQQGLVKPLIYTTRQVLYRNLWRL